MCPTAPNNGSKQKNKVNKKELNTLFVNVAEFFGKELQTRSKLEKFSPPDGGAYKIIKAKFESIEISQEDKNKIKPLLAYCEKINDVLKKQSEFLKSLQTNGFNSTSQKLFYEYTDALLASSKMVDIYTAPTNFDTNDEYMLQTNGQTLNSSLIEVSMSFGKRVDSVKEIVTSLKRTGFNKSGYNETDIKDAISSANEKLTNLTQQETVKRTKLYNQHIANMLNIDTPIFTKTLAAVEHNEKESEYYSELSSKLEIDVDTLKNMSSLEFHNVVLNHIEKHNMSAVDRQNLDALYMSKEEASSQFKSNMVIVNKLIDNTLNSDKGVKKSEVERFQRTAQELANKANTNACRAVTNALKEAVSEKKKRKSKSGPKRKIKTFIRSVTSGKNNRGDAIVLLESLTRRLNEVSNVLSSEGKKLSEDQAAELSQLSIHIQRNTLQLGKVLKKNDPVLKTINNIKTYFTNTEFNNESNKKQIGNVIDRCLDTNKPTLDKDANRSQRNMMRK